MVALRTQPLYTTDLIFARIEQVWSEETAWGDFLQASRSALPSRGPESPQSFAAFLLPGLCCQAAGGDASRAVGVASAWVLLYTAAHLLDDVEDGDIVEGASRVINTATGLIFTALRVLSDARDASLTGQECLNAIQDFATVAFRMCGAQHTDWVDTTPSLARGFEIVEAKAGSYFALACRLGASLAPVPLPVINHYSEFGNQLGILLQINDDLHGLYSKEGKKSDIATGKRSLPIVYALEVIPSEMQNELRTALAAAPANPRAESKARDLIESAGAPVYLAIEAERHYNRAVAELQAANPLPGDRNGLAAFLEMTRPSRQG